MPYLTKSILDQNTVRLAKPKNRRYELRDAALRGFMLRISPSGHKAWYVQLGRNRKRKIGDASVLSSHVARHRARDLLQRADRLSSGEASQPLYAFLMGRYCEHRQQRSRYAQRDLKRLVSALGPLASQPLDQLSLSQIERWKLQRHRKVKPATLARELGELRAALNYAVTCGLIPSNPLRGVKVRMPVQSTPPRVLSDSEHRQLHALLSQRQDYLGTLVILALNTGLTRGELFRLRWNDVNLGNNAWLRVRNPRNFRSARRVVPLNRAAKDALLTWRKRRSRRGTLVFPSPTGGFLKSIDGPWARLVREAGIRNFSLRNCRDDFAARLVMKGIPITRVQELLGHSSPALTARYGGFAPGTARDAVEKLDPP